MPPFPFFVNPPFKKNYYNPYFPSNLSSNYNYSNKNNGKINSKITYDANLIDVKADCNNSINNMSDVNGDDTFDFFGLKLHSDDLLIIGLLFFLYKEDVKDPYLYISLILLLLS